MPARTREGFLCGGAGRSACTAGAAFFFAGLAGFAGLVAAGTSFSDIHKPNNFPSPSCGGGTGGAVTAGGAIAGLGSCVANSGESGFCGAGLRGTNTGAGFGTAGADVFMGLGDAFFSGGVCSTGTCGFGAAFGTLGVCAGTGSGRAGCGFSVGEGLAGAFSNTTRITTSAGAAGETDGVTLTGGAAVGVCVVLW